MADGDVCQECGCSCDCCQEHELNDKEIMSLRQQLADRDKHIEQMENSFFLNAQKLPTGEIATLHHDIANGQDKYDRLLESHRKLQKVNQGLEDKLLKIVDKYETDKAALNRDLANLTLRLVEARVAVAELEDENERYRNDCNLAVQLLQCKPSNFISHKLDTLPADLQQKVKHHMNQRRRDQQNTIPPPPPPDVKTIRVPISTFPPTAMVYSVNRVVDDSPPFQQPPPDLVSAAVMAKVLEERAKERINSAKKRELTCNKSTQTYVGAHYCDGSHCVGCTTCTGALKYSGSQLHSVLVHPRGGSEPPDYNNAWNRPELHDNSWSRPDSKEYSWVRSSSSSTETEI